MVRITLRFASPSRACFAREKVPFFPKAIIFLYGDTTKCDGLQRNATWFGRNWPFWCVLPPKWIFLKKRPCGWLPLNHLGFIDYYTNKTQGWLSTWKINWTYIHLHICYWKYTNFWAAFDPIWPYYDLTYKTSSWYLYSTMWPATTTI